MKLKEYLPLLLVLILGACLRLYRIRDYLIFLGDEGRDVLVVKRMLIDHIPTLLGPISSVGGMYLGPIYYYFMAPFLWLFGYDPVGPAVMVALFGIATIYLVYKTGKEFFNTAAGIIASLLYATSPTIIVYSHSSWNPNILPFFSLLIIYSLLKIIRRGRWQWFFIAGLSFGIALQLHYLALLLLPVCLATAFLLRKKVFVMRWLLAFFGALLTFSPYILFELRHNFTNTRTVLQFITKHEGGSTFGIYDILTRIQDISLRLFGKFVVGDTMSIGKIYVVVLVAFLIYKLYRYITRSSQTRSITPLGVLFLWSGVGIILLTLYQGAVYDYYFAALFPAPFLLGGYLLSVLYNGKSLSKIAAIGIISFSLFQFTIHSPLRTEPNRLIDQIEAISRFIYIKTQGKPYNFALMSSGNSDHAYRYFLEMWGNPPIAVENTVIDPERKTVQNQLLIVCEEQVCQPLGNSLWEIAGYGPAEVDGIWEVFPVKIIRLVPYKHE